MLATCCSAEDERLPPSRVTLVLKMESKRIPSGATSVAFEGNRLVEGSLSTLVFGFLLTGSFVVLWQTTCAMGGCSRARIRKERDFAGSRPRKAAM